MYKVVEQIPMLNGKVVEPIEIRQDGVAIYPIGTVIKAKVVPVKSTGTAKPIKKKMNMQIDLTNLFPETFENNYGWDRTWKEIRQFRNRQIIERQQYWQSEEGLVRIDELMEHNRNIHYPRTKFGFGEKV